MNLCSGVGAVASVMSEFVQPINSICDNHPNQPKNRKLQGVVSVEVDVKVVRGGANVVFFKFTHKHYLNQKF